MKTTQRVARILGVHRVTLQRWIASGRLKAPKLIRMNGGSVRLWDEKDIARAKKAAKGT